VTRKELIAEQKRREWLNINLFVIPNEVEVGLLGDDDGALEEALAVQGADVARPASEPEERKNIAQARNFEIGLEELRQIRRWDVIIAR